MIRNFLIGGILAGVVVAAIALSIHWMERSRAESVSTLFEQALEQKDYETALGIYREVQERSLEEERVLSFQDLYKMSLNQMETEIGTRIGTAYDTLTDRPGLDAETLALMTGMQEVSGMLLSRLARATCESYLEGNGEADRVGRILSDLRKVPAVTASIDALRSELPAMVEARPEFESAAGLQADGEWLEAASGYLDLVDSNTGFIREYAQNRLQICRQGMRTPVLEEVTTLMEGGRFYTAKEKLLLLERIFPDDEQIKERLDACEAPTTMELETWTGSIEHVAIRPLIADSSMAFGIGTSGYSDADTLLTTREFQAILEQLYEREYVLVDLPAFFSFTEAEGGIVAARKALRLPVGKKPLVLGIEGLNYYAARRSAGGSTSLSLDANGHVVSTYPVSGGGTQTDADGEAIGILETFLAEHPDFSFNGARGTISLTGFECIFGAITDRDQLDDRNFALQKLGESTIAPTDDEIETNRKQVLSVIRSLSEHGWTFASSTYGAIDVVAATQERLVKDTGKWMDQVGTLTGTVEILVYPNGSWLKNTDPRVDVLKEAGFRIYCGIGTSSYLSVGKNSVYMDRVLLTGYALRHVDLRRFLDAKEVLDPLRP